jgi:hypothetical protein
LKKFILQTDPATGKWPEINLDSNYSKVQVVFSNNTKTSIPVIEYEDKLFRLESAVVLPEGETVASENTSGHIITPLGITTEILQLLYEKNKNASNDNIYSILIAGHTDTSGNLSYNQELSQNRAKTVFALIKGDHELFASICCQLNRWMKVADYKQILSWICRTFNWDCDPGNIDNNHDTKTQNAVNKFKSLYNSSGPGSIWAEPINPEWGDPNTKQTWIGYFNCYQEKIAKNLGVSIDKLADYRACLHFATENKWVGCNEHHPLIADGTDNLREQKNRRVEVTIWEPNDTIPNLACYPDRSSCNKGMFTI